MADSGLEPLLLSRDGRRTLENWVKRRSTARGLALRARAVLACADGGSDTAVAARLGVNFKTVSRRRARFLRDRLDGLTGEPWPGVLRTITDAQVEEVIGHPRDLRQPVRAQGARSAEAAAGPPARPAALHPGLLLLGQPGRAVVRRAAAPLPRPRGFLLPRRPHDGARRTDRALGRYRPAQLPPARLGAGGRFSAASVPL
jgi:hypothetical protein